MVSKNFRLPQQQAQYNCIVIFRNVKSNLQNLQILQFLCPISIYIMDFRRFFQEAGGLFRSDGPPLSPGTALNSKDLYNHEYGPNSGVGMYTGQSQPQQPVRRMKKMPKK
jgi:hypothetical protein